MVDTATPAMTLRSRSDVAPLPERSVSRRSGPDHEPPGRARRGLVVVTTDGERYSITRRASASRIPVTPIRGRRGDPGASREAPPRQQDSCTTAGHAASTTACRDSCRRGRGASCRNSGAEAIEASVSWPVSRPAGRSSSRSATATTPDGQTMALTSAKTSTGPLRAAAGRLPHRLPVLLPSRGGPHSPEACTGDWRRNSISRSTSYLTGARRRGDRRAGAGEGRYIVPPPASAALRETKLHGSC